MKTTKRVKKVIVWAVFLNDALFETGSSKEYRGLRKHYKGWSNGTIKFVKTVGWLPITPPRKK